MEIVPVDAVAADELIETPGVRLARVAGEGGAHGDAEAHHLGRVLGEFAGVEAAQAPADHADRPPVLRIKLAQLFVRPLEYALSEPEIEPLSPA